MEWILVGIFHATYNYHAVIERFESKQTCEKVRSELLRTSKYGDGLNEDSKCIKILKDK